ncbi:hypothetical protein BDP67DRAFT_510073 [Colletotrichum lupini]|nr:hypothetical protein BDP67DRAFT_510073 [Colletotrichum lupini]
MRLHGNNNRHDSEVQGVGREALLSACCGPHNEPRYIFEEGLKQFASLLESRISDYEDITKDLMEVLGKAQPGCSYLEKQTQVCTKIVGFINASANHQTTVDDISDWLMKEYDVPIADRRDHKNVLRHLVFAVLGWSTMLYTPSFTEPAADFSTATERQSNRNATKQSLNQSSQRPLGAVLRSHGLMPIACPPGFGPPPGPPTLLTVTHLNFWSLSRLGDVTILWVDDLSKHCTFDRYSSNKELRIFRLPSLCAKVYLNNTNYWITRQKRGPIR